MLPGLRSADSGMPGHLSRGDFSSSDSLRPAKLAGGLGSRPKGSAASLLDCFRRLDLGLFLRIADGCHVSYRLGPAQSLAFLPYQGQFQQLNAGNGRLPSDGSGTTVLFHFFLLLGE